MPLEETESKVLIALLSSGEVSVSDLQQKAGVSSPNSVTRSVGRLIEKGLAMQEEEKKFPRRRLIRLTLLGQKTAQKLVEAEVLSN